MALEICNVKTYKYQWLKSVTLYVHLGRDSVNGLRKKYIRTYNHYTSYIRASMIMYVHTYKLFTYVHHDLEQDFSSTQN